MISLIDALAGKSTQKEFKFGEQKVILRTLTQGEMNSVMQRIPRSDLMPMIELIKVPELARALVSINGVNVEAFDDFINETKKTPNKDKYLIIEEMLEKMDTFVISALYNVYSSFKEEISKQKEELKNA